jgi:hypothetical protein
LAWRLAEISHNSLSIASCKWWLWPAYLEAGRRKEVAFRAYVTGMAIGGIKLFELVDDRWWRALRCHFWFTWRDDYLEALEPVYNYEVNGYCDCCDCLSWTCCLETKEKRGNGQKVSWVGLGIRPSIEVRAKVINPSMLVDGKSVDF